MSARRRNHALWLGPLITLAGGLSYFLWFVRFPALRDFPWVNLPLVLLGLGLSALGFWRAFFRTDRYRGKIWGSIGLVVGVGLAGLFGLYVFVISYSLPEPSPTTLGLSVAPDFALAAHDGSTIRLSELRGKKVVMVFYRGFW